MPAGDKKYRVWIEVGSKFDLQSVKRGIQEEEKLLSNFVRSQLTAGRKLHADQLKEVTRYNRDQVRVLGTGARDVAKQYEQQLGRGFFSKLAREASSAFKSSFSIGGGGGGGGGISGIIGGALSVAGGGLITSVVSGITSQITGAIKTGFDFNKIKEQTLLGFEIKLKGRKEAEDFFTQIARFAQTSEQELPQVLDSVQRLMSAFDAPQALQSIQAITDRVAATGKTGGEAKDAIDGIALALQQVIYKNRLAGQEVVQLAERQVNAFKYIAEEIGKTDASFAALTDEERIGRVTEMAEKGMLNAKASVAVIIRGMEKEFGGTSARIAKETLAGIESNTSDRVAQLSGKASEKAFEQYKDFRTKVLNLLNSPAGDRAAGGIDAVVGQFTKGMDATIGAMRSGDMSALGFSAVGSVATGAAEAGKSLFKAGVDAAGQLVEGVESRLDMHSPSQVMIGLGECAGMSFQQGFARAMRRGGFSEEIEKLIEENAKRTGLDPNLLRSMIKQESGGRTNARSPVGAAGIAQFMPGTARDYGLRVNSRVDDRLDPTQAIRAMADHVRDLVNTNGNIAKALAAYNAGQGAVNKYGGVPPYKETRNYVSSIMADYERRGTTTGASGGSFRAGFGAQGRAMEMPPARPFTEGRGLGMPMPVYVVNSDELRGLKGRDAQEHGDMIEQTKVPVYERGRLVGYDTYDPSDFSGAQLRGLQGRDATEHGTQLDLTARNGITSVFGAVGAGVQSTRQLNDALAETPKALEKVNAAAEDAFGNLPPLINTAAAEAKEEAKEFGRMAQDIAGAFGGGFELLLRGKPRQAMRALRQDFAAMLIGMARDWLQSSIFNLLNGKGTGGGGGLLGSLGKLFGIGGGSKSSSSGSSATSGGALPVNPSRWNLVNDLLSGQTGVGAPASATPGSLVRSATGSATGTTGAAANVAGKSSSIGRFLNSPAFQGATLGASLGLGLGGQSRGGQLLGLAGGALAGAAAGSIASGISNFGVGIALGTTSALTFATLGIGAALLIGAVIAGRNAARRRDERSRNQLATDARSRVYQLISAVRADSMDGAEALKEYDRIVAEYKNSASQLKDSKARRHALAWVNDLNGQVLPQLKREVESQKARKVIGAQLHPTFSGGGGVWSQGGRDGGATHPAFASMMGLDHFGSGIVPGAMFDRKDDRLIRVSKKEVILTPDVWRPITPYLKRQKVRGFEGFEAGGAVDAATIAMTVNRAGSDTGYGDGNQANRQPIIITFDRLVVEVSKSDVSSVVFEGMKSSTGQKIMINGVRENINSNPAGIPLDIRAANEKSGRG
jgi:tape measure domain-containing protein